jgi:hypothetical protein
MLNFTNSSITEVKLVTVIYINHFLILLYFTLVNQQIAASNIMLVNYYARVPAEANRFCIAGEAVSGRR